MTTVTVTARDAANNAGITTFTVTVAPLTSLQSWREQNYGITSNTGNASNGADPYHTGIQNLTAFAFGLNPISAHASQLPQGQTIGANLVITFTQPAAVTGITYGAEWSGTLESSDWHLTSDSGSGSQHTFNAPIGANTKLFMRLNVTAP